MRMNVKVIAVVCILLLTLTSAIYAQDERKIKMDEYKVQLADWQARETAANEKIVTLEAEIEDLKTQINDTQVQIDGTWGEIYTALGTDEAGVEAYRSELADIDSEIDALSALSPEDLFRRKDEIKAVKERIMKAKESKVSYLTEMEMKLAELDGKLAALKAKVPANIYDQYTVIKGDYLWKIAKRPDIYSDPLQWIRIYNVNKDQIKNADLIYPDQIFNIARGVAENEHLVAKGEFLFGIAGMAKIFGDPSKWTKLYEANKDIISDPNLIYPYQVLTIPKE